MPQTETSPGDGGAPATKLAGPDALTCDGTACVVDLDNLLHRGIEKSSGTSRRRAQLDVMMFASELRKRGVTQGTICRNWDFHLLEQRLWNALGFDTVAARTNCDAKAMLAAIAFVEAGYRELVLVTGDGDYVDVVRVMQDCGVRVEIWARRATTAAALIEAADSIRFIDGFLHIPGPAGLVGLAA